MRCRFRIATVVLFVCLSPAATLWADSITYRFEGQVETTTGMVPPSVGDTLLGFVIFDIPGTDAPPGALTGFFQTRQDIFHVSFAHESGGPAFDERTLYRQLFTINTFNDIDGFDELGITLSTFTFPQFNFHIDLVDRTASAFANANLPASPNLNAFQERNFVASIQVRRGGAQAVVGTFGGRITSLVGGPGPSIVPEPSSLLLLGPATLAIVRRARIKKGVSGLRA